MATRHPSHSVATVITSRLSIGYRPLRALAAATHAPSSAWMDRQEGFALTLGIGCRLAPEARVCAGWRDILFGSFGPTKVGADNGQYCSDMTNLSRSERATRRRNVALTIVVGLVLAALSSLVIYILSAFWVEKTIWVGLGGLLLGGIGLLLSSRIDRSSSAKLWFDRTRSQWLGIVIGFIGMCLSGIGVLQSI